MPYGRKPDQAIIDSILSGTPADALPRLVPREREVLVRALVERKLSTGQIAYAIGCSWRTVVRIYRRLNIEAAHWSGDANNLTHRDLPSVGPRRKVI